MRVVQHSKNKGYGGNQKTCYTEALSRGADIVIMLHPDYQYTPKLIPAISSLLSCGEFDVVLASRILGGRAIQGGMPLYKYISNRFLTFVQNLLLATKISEYHTGYRAFTKEVLESLPLDQNSDDFIFDNQMLSQIIYKGWKVGELSCPTKYFPEASSINFARSVKYGLGCLLTATIFRLSKWGFLQHKIFNSKSLR
ncbi:MAG TPA: glycosyltransferase family 2 protein [Vampirovibrionales bacterium]